jgi:hypothetical protein
MNITQIGPTTQKIIQETPVLLNGMSTKYYTEVIIENLCERDNEGYGSFDIHMEGDDE